MTFEKIYICTKNYLTMKAKLLFSILIASVALMSCEKDNPARNDENDVSDDSGTVVTDDNAGSSIATDDKDDYISNTTFARTVSVVYSESGAQVSGADGLTVDVSGNDVTITNNGSEVIMYELSGSASDGFFKLYSSKKQGLTLNGLNLTNPAGAAINNQSHKRTFVVLKGESKLADGSSYTDAVDTEDMKAAFFSEAQLIFSGDGSLSVTATGKAGITSDDYVRFIDDATTVKVSSTAGHGIRGKDAIIVSAGNIDVNVSATGKKGFSTDTLIYFGGGVTNITSTASAGIVDDELTGAAGIKADYRFEMDGGKVTVNCSGTGAKGISGDNVAYFNGGELYVTVTGSNYGSSSSGGGMPGMGGPGGGFGGNSSSSSDDDTSKAAKGIKFDGNAYFNEGCYVVVNATNHEAIEAKGKLEISGGTVYAYSRSDDAINAGGDLTINGGYVYGRSAGNDGIDANGNMYINGGLVYASSATSPEVGLDANTEGGYKLYIKGGTVIAFGGIERGSVISVPYVTTNYTKSSAYALCDGNDALFCFYAPESGGSGMYIFSDQLKKKGEYTLLKGPSFSGGTKLFAGQLVEGAGVSGGTATKLTAN